MVNVRIQQIVKTLGKTWLGDVNKLFVLKSLLASPIHCVEIRHK